jgi:hypothetical protein
VSLAAVALADPPTAALVPASGDRLVVHEWGTFTSLQDEAGRPIRGINTDDEPLPDFVHRLSHELIIDPSELAPVYYKGVPRVHRDVTMRLETPVIYFYPPAARHEPLRLDVRVEFRGGWLTEYFPDATVNAPGLAEGEFRFERIAGDTVGSLEWTNLEVGGRPRLLETDSRVWLAPRRVSGAAVETAAGEAEKYLFYRGVGHLAAPLTVTRDAQGDTLGIIEGFDPRHIPSSVGARAATRLWLVEVREDGAVAFRSLGQMPLAFRPGRVLATTPAGFSASEFSRGNLDELRTEMHAALVQDGLFADEAEALLATWQLGYFESPGMRLFFLLPRCWTDAVLPLDISMPADVVRTMVGRIELVTPRHRELLERLSTGPVTQPEWFYTALQRSEDQGTAMRALWEGKACLADVKVHVPEDYRAYLGLGRFRNALILDELSQRRSTTLDEFARCYHLSYFAE